MNILLIFIELRDKLNLIDDESLATEIPRDPLKIN